MPHGQPTCPQSAPRPASTFRWRASPTSRGADASDTILLPIQHYRFRGAVFQKIDLALREKSYYSQSAYYSLLSELLKAMEETNGSFLYRHSRQLESFADFTETRNAFGL